MNRRDALKTIGTAAGSVAIAQLLPACDLDADENVLASAIAAGYTSNFVLLNRDTSWRSSWSQIVSGKFSSSPFSGLVFYDAPAGIVEIYTSDGTGHITLLHSTTGFPTTYTHLVPGRFESASGLTSLLFYSAGSGAAAFYTVSTAGVLTQMRSSMFASGWTHVISGYYTSSMYSGLFFYNQSTGSNYIYGTDGTGGLIPVRALSGLGTGWTHVVSGQFLWNPGTNEANVYSHLYFYSSVGTSGRMYFNDFEHGLFDAFGSTQTGLPSANRVVAGNFGGNGRAHLMLYGSDLVVFMSYDDSAKVWTAFETLGVSEGVPTSADRIVAGNFSMADPEDHWFQDGPAGKRNWLPAPGVFSGLVFFQASAHTGSFFAHEPPRPSSRSPASGGIEGFITTSTTISTGSVRPGDTINVRISSPSSCTVALLRPGIDTQPLVQLGQFSPGVRPVDRLAYRDGVDLFTGWPTTTSYAVPSNWASGLYVARVQSQSGTLDIPFVVRAPSPGTTSRVLVVVADANYEAYNTFGGRCLYGFSTANEFSAVYPQTQWRCPYAFAVSFNRAFAGWTPETGNPSAKWQYWEIPLLKWLVREGIPYEVCTDRDLEFNPPNVANCRVLMFAGHHEYWSKGMRDNVEAFTNAGGNVMFLCGNTCWWQVRFENNGARMVCYKQAEFDPAVAPLDTVNWYTFSPETSLTGVSYLNTTPLHTSPADQFTIVDSSHWAFAGTGLDNQDLFGAYEDADSLLQSVLGPESDMQQNEPNSTPPVVSPATFWPVARGFVDGSEAATMGSFQRGGGTVFTAPTMNWVLGLSPTAKNPTVMDMITRNAVSRLRVQPFHVGRAAAYDAFGQLWVFVRKTDNSIWYSHEIGAGGSWGGWASLGGVGRSSPVAARHPDGHLEMFVLDTTNKIQRRWWSVDNSTVSPWTTLGGPAVGLSGRPTIAHNLDGRLEAFARGLDGAVWHAWQVAVNGPWSTWASLGGSVVGIPSVIAQLDGRLTVFARGANGTLQQAVQAAINGPWAAFTSLGGSLKADPAVGRNLDGHLEVFAVQTTDQLAHTSQLSNGSWTGWVNVGSTAMGTPAIGMNLDGRLEVISVGLDGAVGHIWQLAPNGGWSAWQSFGGATSSRAPDVGINRDGRMEMFVVNASDGVLQHGWQVAPNGAWAALTGLPGISVIPD